MKKLFLFFSVVAALFFCSCAKEEPDVWGTISGVVKDAQSNQPIEGVKVTVTATGASQITNSDGQFTFDNLDATEYSLSFEKVGYFTLTQKVTVLAGETATAHVQLKKNNLGIEVTPAMLDFGAGNSSMNLTVKAQSGTVYFSASSNATWLTVSPANASVSTSTVLQVFVSRANLAPGSYNGAITITANSENLVIPVYMQVAGAGQPVVTVESIVSVTQTTATVNGVLTLENGVSVSDYGVCYSTNAMPTINNSKISRGGTSQSTSYSCQLSGLSSGTEYYVRAYAVTGGQTYYGNTKSFTTSSQSGGGGGGTEDYSSARVVSDNPYITLTLRGCHRSGVRVTIEAVITNTGVNAYTNYILYQNNYGYTLGTYTYNSRVSDDLYTSYDDYAVTKYLGSQSSIYNLGASLPVNSPQILKVTIDGVPNGASTINLYLATVFQNANPREYAYLTFENVHIY